MNERVLSKENLKCILYAIFDNYSNLSKKIYVVVDVGENSEQIIEIILKKINQNTPYFIRKILSDFKDDSESSMSKLKNNNKNLAIVKTKEAIEEGIVIDVLNMDFDEVENTYSYESKFVVDYIFSLDDIAKSRFFKELAKELENKAEANKEGNSKIYLNINEFYNLCLAKTGWSNFDDISRMENWIYNIINPNKLDDNLFKKMIENINKELNNFSFDSYLHEILSKKENKSLGYISASSDLYKLLLFEDMLRVDYKEICSARVDLDVEYIGEWWSKNILPLFKQEYEGEDLEKQLKLEVKKNETIDFYGKNFEKLKSKIISEIEKELLNTENQQKDIENNEKISLQNTIKNLNPQSIQELGQIIDTLNIKQKDNKKILKNYCSDKFIDILEEKLGENTLKELEDFLEKYKEYFNDKVSMYFEVCIQKYIQKLEENLLNDICDIKDIKGLEELHNKLLANGEFVKCEDLETIIFTKMESIIKTMNLAEINDEENIKIANSIYDNTSSIDLEKYLVAEILICRDINIDLYDVKSSIEDLKLEVDEIRQVVKANCIFNCEYYNMNIQINQNENYYIIKFRYLNDLIDYIKQKQGNTFVLNLKNMNKDAKHQRRVFSKGNSEIIKEIDDFYLEKQTAKN